MIRFACPTCKAVMNAPAQKAGQKANCPKCGQRLQVPNPTPVAEVPRKEPGRQASAAAPGMASAPVPAVSPFDAIDAEQHGKPRPRRSAWKPYLFGLPAFLLGVAALPSAIAFSSNLLGLLLAGLGTFLALFAAVLSLANKRAGLGLSALSFLACGAALFGAVQLAHNPGGLNSETGIDPGAAPKDKDPQGNDLPKSGTPGASGVPRLYGMATTGYGDLDLWRQNPVEADAKWKAKTVEVEMNSGGLNIDQYGDDAALITPSQCAIFIFRGDNRKQLIGFQNFSGVVVIRWYLISAPSSS